MMPTSICLTGLYPLFYYKGTFDCFIALLMHFQSHRMSAELSNTMEAINKFAC
jgi:hypothetical protein